MTAEPAYPSTKTPVIEAVIHGLFRFENLAQAQDKLQFIATTFTQSKHQPDPEKTDKQTLMWIKHFAVTPKEEEQGYKGNFALIYCAKSQEGYYTLAAKKEEVPLSHHPQRKQPKHKYPNWGHYVLRAVKSKKMFNTAEEAQEFIQALHKDFPNCSTPTIASIKIRVFEPTRKLEDKEAKPTAKYLIFIDQEGDKFFLNSEVDA